MKNKLEFWIFVFFPILLIATVLLAYSSFQRKGADIGSVTSAIDRTQIMLRGNKEKLAAFALVTSDLYGAVSIQGYEGLFDEQILKDVGLVPRADAGKQTCDQLKQNRLQAKAKAHTFYSPFAFLPETYVRLQSRPLVTEPPFTRDFPLTILMLPMTEEANAAVAIIDCGQRVFMVPISNASGQTL